MSRSKIQKVAISFLSRVPYAPFALQSCEQAVRYTLRRPVEVELDFLASRHNFLLDIGANIGQSALAFARANPNGRIHSVEPLPKCERSLKYIQKFLPTRFTFEMLGVSDYAGTVTLHTPQVGRRLYLQESTADIAVLEEAVANGRLPKNYTLISTIVQVSTVDEIVSKFGFGTPDLLKIDTQGYEAKVLNGAKELLKNSNPTIIVESSNDNERIGEFLNGYGYLPFMLEHGKLEPIHDLKTTKTLNLIFSNLSVE